MTNQGDRLRVRMALEYKGAQSARALEKWIPDALDRYFNADQPGQMYVDEISVEPAEPVPPVPEGRCARIYQKVFGDLAARCGQPEPGHLARFGHDYLAERPAEGTD